jgi:hypothetical protein
VAAIRPLDRSRLGGAVTAQQNLTVIRSHRPRPQALAYLDAPRKACRLCFFGSVIGGGHAPSTPSGHHAKNCSQN